MILWLAASFSGGTVLNAIFWLVFFGLPWPILPVGIAALVVLIKGVSPQPRAREAPDFVDVTGK